MALPNMHFSQNTIFDDINPLGADMRLNALQ